MFYRLIVTQEYRQKMGNEIGEWQITIYRYILEKCASNNRFNDTQNTS